MVVTDRQPAMSDIAPIEPGSPPEFASPERSCRAGSTLERSSHTTPNSVACTAWLLAASSSPG